MRERRQFEHFVFRYVPHAVRDQYADFGLMLIEKGKDDGYVGIRFAPNWRGILHLDPRADIEVLAAFEREITGQLAGLKDREIVLRWMEDTFSNTIQLSPRRSSIADDPERELDALASMYLKDPQLSGGQRREGARQMLVRGMESEFKRAGILDLLMQGVPAAQYTRADDSFAFDFGYVLGDKLKLFHGVSLIRSVNSAIEVASKYKKVVENRKAETLLTTIVENDLNREEERISYTIDAMRRERIQIAELREMGEIAETARLELRA